jgi:D-alanyl-D-alanine carboxypeptidase
MRSLLTPLLFEDDEWLDPWESASVVVQVLSATPAILQASTQRTLEKFPVQSFRTLVTNLSTIAKNRVQPKLAAASVSFDLTMPNPLQQKAFDLLGVPLTF